MEPDALSTLYLFFRLSPFIIASYFSLQSLFNQDVRGLVYLIGMLLLFLLFNLLRPILSVSGITTADATCHLVAPGIVSNVPAGQAIFGYTFAYLLYYIHKYGLYTTNVPTLVLFPMLILADLVWNKSNSCFDMPALLTTLGVGCGFGVAWGMAISALGVTSLQYYAGPSQESCSMPTGGRFVCKARGGKVT